MSQPSRPPLASSPSLPSAWATQVLSTFVEAGSLVFGFRVRSKAASRHLSLPLW